MNLKTIEQYEVEITRLKAALVTINEQVSELARKAKRELAGFDNRAVYQSIKAVSGDALKGK